MDFQLERRFALEGATQMAYDDDVDVHEIYIEHPDANILTDEDSDEEDGGGLLDNLNGRHLLPKADLVVQSAVTADEDESDFFLVRSADGSDPNDVFLRPGLENITWIQDDFEEKTRSFSEPDYSKYKEMSYLDIFGAFLDDEVIGLFVEQSNQYAFFCNQSNPNISKEEMKLCHRNYDRYRL
ncbi:hypothetical protein JTB14_019043 [Gonioctena quinquepunctata]|nr:hypothetical protein JTB14_019043 [Gonioctena quinquepunctata]